MDYYSIEETVLTLSQFWGWFLTLNTPLQILIILIIFYAFKMGWINLPWGKIFPFIKFRKKKKDHEDCPLYPDLKQQKREAFQNGSRAMEIKRCDVIYEQMTIVRTTGETVTDDLTDQYKSMIDKVDLSEQQRSAALTLYAEVIEGAVDDVSGYLRKWVKRNHLTSMSDVEFQAYILKRTEEAQKKVSKYIDRRYMEYLFIIPREELREANTRFVLPELSKLVSTMFVEIRAVAEEKLKMVDELEKEGGFYGTETAGG